MKSDFPGAPERLKPATEGAVQPTVDKKGVEPASIKAQLRASEARVAGLRDAFSEAEQRNDACPDGPKEQFATVQAMDQLKELVSKEGGLLLYHGGLPEETTLETIDLSRSGTQQNKPGRTYGGFYLTDESSKRWSDDYARARNGNVHGFWIDPSSRIVEVNGTNIDRLSQQQRDAYAEKYDLIKGKDLMGRAQFVLLNKDVVKGVGKERL